MQKQNSIIFGIHAVLAAFDAGKQVEVVFIKREAAGENINELKRIAKQFSVPFKLVPIDFFKPYQSKNHQGVLARICPIDFYNAIEIVQQKFEEGKNPLLLALDGITDVRNFGAIARSAEVFGVDGIIIPETHSVSINEDAVKTSAGALSYIKVCRVKNLFSALEELKNSGLKIISCSEKGKEKISEIDFDIPAVLVLGDEGQGVSNQVMRISDHKVSIPQRGKTESLNVSVAASIFIYEATKKI